MHQEVQTHFKDQDFHIHEGEAARYMLGMPEKMYVQAMSKESN
jgi:hypothetical protein